MNDLIVVANHGPAALSSDAEGNITIKHAAGGLAPSLAGALSGTGALWFAAAMNETERAVAKGTIPPPAHDGLEFGFVDISADVLASAYRVIANATLWFLYHGLFDASRRPIFNRRFYEAWEMYRSYNESFADEIVRHASPGATVVVNDYHLSLLGSTLARERPDLKTVHFSHTPFCEPGELRMLPDTIARELIGGLSSFGAVGFHTKRWADSFERCAQMTFGAVPHTFAVGLGTDAKELATLNDSPSVVAYRQQLLERLAGRKLIFRSDRAELSKNLIRGFLAYEELLEDHPELQDQVVFLARAYPSREELPEYLSYRADVERTVERINEKFSHLQYAPIVLEVADDFEASIAALSCYDVLLVNPIRDGMNLVAKEGTLVNKRNGVLALSREAGAFEGLKDGVLSVEPFDVTGTADVLWQALNMSAEERTQRSVVLREIAGACPPKTWLSQLVREARPVACP